MNQFGLGQACLGMARPDQAWPTLAKPGQAGLIFKRGALFKEASLFLITDSKHPTPYLIIKLITKSQKQFKTTMFGSRAIMFGSQIPVVVNKTTETRTLYTGIYTYTFFFAARVNTKLVSRSGKFSHAEPPAVQAAAVKQANRPTTATDRRRGKQN